MTGAAETATALIVLIGIPAAMTTAILKHRLYDIDVIIKRAVVYGLLSAAFTAVYAGIVLGIGTFAGHRGGPVLTIAAAVLIALLFQPLRHRARLLANRLVYGERATPYQVLSDFAEDMAGQLDFGEALDKMVSVLAGAAGATRAEAWIRVGAELRPVATWPGGSPAPAPVALSGHLELPPFEAASRAVAVRHGDEILGALSPPKTSERAADQRRGQAIAAPGLAGRPRPSQRPAHRRAAGHDRRAESLPPPAGGSTGRRETEDRTSACSKNPPGTPTASGSWQSSSRTHSGQRSMTCGTWPAASTRRSSPTRASSQPSKPRHARPRCRS